MVKMGEVVNIKIYIIPYVFTAHLTNYNIQTNILAAVKRIQFLLKEYLNWPNQLKEKSV